MSQRLLMALQERITGGTYAPGDRLPAERELAAEFAVDRSVVRSALARLADAGFIVREPGRRPWVNPNWATGMVKPASKRQGQPLRTVAVVLPQHDMDHASREILRGVSDVLRSHPTPFRPLVFDTNLRTASRGELEQEACAAMEEEGLSGAIVWTTLEEGSLEGWRRVRDLGYPVVFVDRCDDGLPCDFVGVDNYTAAREAVEYLLGLGHKRIAHLSVDDPASTVRERAAGYRDALHTAGISGEQSVPWVTPLGMPSPWLEDFVTHCLEAAEPPTAVFTVTDRLAHHLIALLEARGVAVPDQVSVVGFDDEDRYSARPALLTSVRQPFERIGQRAAELLLRRLSAGASAPDWFQQVLLPTQLIERRTCRQWKVP